MEKIISDMLQYIAGGNDNTQNGQPPLFTPTDVKPNPSIQINGGGGANGAVANINIGVPITDSITVGVSTLVVTNYDNVYVPQANAQLNIKW